ncbi:hypothetical protein AL038_19605 [Beggiatoa leptomitoformis]|uniref:hypothetical protein n=1 Tax=Beggiatoa leptomitoformis TaxID=288004 RepID=UPI000AE0FBA3|nr:hypothetical protein [Beggiatoa leptomitoformis]QGX03861.1 hypothetical protein AL038_19605 [Beggiatoa leptomitoformis]
MSVSGLSVLIGGKTMALISLAFARYQALLGNACLASSACRVQADLSVGRSST